MPASSAFKEEPRSLGPGNLEASPGDHDHKGTTSKELFAGLTLTGSKGGNVALTNLINMLATEFGLTNNTT